MKAELAVTDAHALIWYARNRLKKLGAAARQVFQDAESGKAAIFIPTIVLVEVFEAARRGALELEQGPVAWAQGLWSSGSFFATDLTPAVVYRAEQLYSIPERTDRLIAATAAELGYPLLTRDKEIQASAGVRVIWN